MADQAAAIASAFITVFGPEAELRWCWWHVRDRTLLRHLRPLAPSEEAYKDLIRVLDFLQYVDDKRLSQGHFFEVWKVIVKRTNHWRTVLPTTRPTRLTLENDGVSQTEAGGTHDDCGSVRNGMSRRPFSC